MPNADLPDVVLQECVRALMAFGELPTGKPDAIWGGAGRNDQCNICQLPIITTEIGFDLSFSGSTGEIELHLHQRCNLTWEKERRQKNEESG